MGENGWWGASLSAGFGDWASQADLSGEVVLRSTAEASLACNRHFTDASGQQRTTRARSPNARGCPLPSLPSALQRIRPYGTRTGLFACVRATHPPCIESRKDKTNPMFLIFELPAKRSVR